MAATAMSPFFGIHRYFVCCPGESVTGGPELLHQLVAVLRQQGINASIVYYPIGRTWKTPEPYQRYQCTVNTSIQDARDSAIIVPEIATHLLDNVFIAKRCIWWLSASNYRGSFENFRHFKQYLRRTVRTRVRNPKGIVHLFQSQYAANFVKRRFGMEGYFLSDYLAEEFLLPWSAATRGGKHCSVQSEKGRGDDKATYKLMPSLNFLPLVNISRDEM